MRTSSFWLSRRFALRGSPAGMLKRLGSPRAIAPPHSPPLFSMMLFGDLEPVRAKALTWIPPAPPPWPMVMPKPSIARVAAGRRTGRVVPGDDGDVGAARDVSESCRLRQGRRASRSRPPRGRRSSGRRSPSPGRTEADVVDGRAVSGAPTLPPGPTPCSLTRRCMMTFSLYVPWWTTTMSFVGSQRVDRRLDRRILARGRGGSERPSGCSPCRARGCVIPTGVVSPFAARISSWRGPAAIPARDPDPDLPVRSTRGTPTRAAQERRRG